MFGMKATDCRDRIYGLLGMSSFPGRATVADYTKTKAQVSAEVAAWLIQESLETYMKMTLWAYKSQSTVSAVTDCDQEPSWAPNLDIRSVAYNAWSMYHIDYVLDHYRPTIEFSDNLRTMHTIGHFMEAVSSIENSTFNGLPCIFVTTDQGYGYSTSSVQHSPDLSRCVLVALFGTRAPFLLRQVSSDPPKYMIAAHVFMSGNETEHYLRHWKASRSDSERIMVAWDPPEDPAADADQEIVEITMV